MAQPINVMVIGECGNGKSTLINAVRDKKRSEQPLCGRSPKGVTKAITLYPCPAISGVPLNILDTPGVGDHDVTPAKLVSLMEEFLAAGMISGGIRGLVVTAPVEDGRVRLGAQIVQAIVDKGFVAASGGNKYGNVILCGTKADKAEPADKQNFMSAVKSLFFAKSATGSGLCVMVHKGDYGPLLAAIRQLPATSIAYKKPETNAMAAAMAEKLGVGLEEIRRQAEEQRREGEQVARRVEAERKRRREENQRQEKELQRAAAKKEAEERRAEEQRKEQQRQVEAERRREEEERRRIQEKAAEQKRRTEQRLEEQRRERERLAEQQRRRQAEAERQHQEHMRQMQIQHQRQLEAARHHHGGGGGDCFPASALLQTPTGPKYMSELRVEDRVLSLDGTGTLFYDDVYFFGHASSEALDCVGLLTSSHKLLTSLRHFIPVASDSAAIWAERHQKYAQDVKVGDLLWVQAADGQLACEAVMEVVMETAQGKFNPYTLGGSIVVDGVVASAHSDWLLDDFVPSRWSGLLPAIYQAVFFPCRLLYAALGKTAADALDVNNPQEVNMASTCTSPWAFAFLLASTILPTTVVLTAAAMQTFDTP